MNARDSLALTRASGATLTEQLAAQYGERIRHRLLAPGARLPSVRECARRHGVSPHTVVAAYDQLLAQGLGEARRQRGFFVREAWPSPATGTTYTEGILEPGCVATVTVESDRLVVFGDGLESDCLVATWGQTITVGRSLRLLMLV